MNLPVEEENTKHRTCKNCGVKFTIVSPPDDPRIAFCTSCALDIRARGTKWTYIGCQIETQIEKTPIGIARSVWDAQWLCIAHNRLAHNPPKAPESKPENVMLNQHDVQNLALAFSNIKFNSRTSKRTKYEVIVSQFFAYELGLERGRQLYGLGSGIPKGEVTE